MNFVSRLPPRCELLTLEEASDQWQAGLPDDIFSNQIILEGLALKDVCIFYVNLIHFMVIW
jgi:hypothetical protein